MARTIIKGKAHVYGDNIDTDAIIPGKYTKTLNLQTFADHVMEDLDPEFRKKVQKGDILVAGDNFGCGSSREQAPLALKLGGVSVVISKYFARIFFRNAINIGLPVVICHQIKDYSIADGEVISVDLEKGEVTFRGNTLLAEKLPDFMAEILKTDGLINYYNKFETKKNGT